MMPLATFVKFVNLSLFNIHSKYYTESLPNIHYVATPLVLSLSLERFLICCVDVKKMAQATN